MTSASPSRPHVDDLAALIGEVDRLETVIAGWEEDARAIAEAYRGAVDALHREALRRLIAAVTGEPAARDALRHAAADPALYAVLRHHGLIRPSLNERIEAALATIRPMLASHGGDARLMRVTSSTAEIELIGACGGCAASAVTFQAGIKKAIQEACPEIAEIVQVAAPTRSDRHLVSPFARQPDGGAP